MRSASLPASRLQRISVPVIADIVNPEKRRSATLVLQRTKQINTGTRLVRYGNKRSDIHLLSLTFIVLFTEKNGHAFF
jgi:hypothetical protein